MDATLRIVIKLNNSTFEENPAHEVARILRQLSFRLEEEILEVDFYKALMDINGNYVGFVEVAND